MSDSILMMSEGGTPYDFYDPALMPNREQMEEPFELLQISIQPYGKNLTVTILQSGVRPVKYTAFSGSAFQDLQRQADVP